MFSQEGEEDRSSRGSTLNSNVARRRQRRRRRVDEDSLLVLGISPFSTSFHILPPSPPFFFSHLCFAQPTCHRVERSTEERERIEQKKTRKFSPPFFPLSFSFSLSFFLFLYFFLDFPSLRIEFLVRVGGWIVAFDIPRYLPAIGARVEFGIEDSL